MSVIEHISGEPDENKVQRCIKCGEILSQQAQFEGTDIWMGANFEVGVSIYKEKIGLVTTTTVNPPTTGYSKECVSTIVVVNPDGTLS